MIPPKCYDIFPPLTGGCSEGLDAFRFFFKHTILHWYCAMNLTLEEHRDESNDNSLPFPSRLVVQVIFEELRIFFKKKEELQYGV